MSKLQDQLQAMKSGQELINFHNGLVEEGKLKVEPITRMPRGGIDTLRDDIYHACWVANLDEDAPASSDDHAHEEEEAQVALKKTRGKKAAPEGEDPGQEEAQPKKARRARKAPAKAKGRKAPARAAKARKAPAKTAKKAKAPKKAAKASRKATKAPKAAKGRKGADGAAKAPRKAPVAVERGPLNTRANTHKQRVVELLLKAGDKGVALKSLASKVYGDDDKAMGKVRMVLKGVAIAASLTPGASFSQEDGTAYLIQKGRPS